MGKSDITKRAIAHAFRSLLATTPFEKVTVSAITATCGINRQTFYYHFHDIYDLVEWMVDTEIASVLDSEPTNWRSSIEALYTSLQADRGLVMHRMRTADPLIMYHLLKEKITGIVLHTMTSYEQESLSRHDPQGIAVDFFAGGLAEVTLSWLEGGCVTSPAEMIAQIDQALTQALPHLVLLRKGESPA